MSTPTGELSDEITTSLKEMMCQNDVLIEKVKGFCGKAAFKRQMYVPVYCSSDATFSLKSVTRMMDYASIVAGWRVPEALARPSDPDEDQLLYGKHGEVMEMKCETFEDLVRHNKQASVGIKYSTMLRETVAVVYGKKFLENLKLVRAMLECLVSDLDSEAPSQEQLEEELKNINAALVKMANHSNVMQRYLKIDESEILSDTMQDEIFNMLGPDDGSKSFKRILTSREGTSNTIFDTAATGKANILIVIQEKVTGFVFGGYIKDTFQKGGSWITGSRENFVFSLGKDNSHPVKYMRKGEGQGLHQGCGLHMGSDLIAFCSHSCNPSVYTTVAPGYTPLGNGITISGNPHGAYSFGLMEVFFAM